MNGHNGTGLNEDLEILLPLSCRKSANQLRKLCSNKGVVALIDLFRLFPFVAIHFKSSYKVEFGIMTVASLRR